MDDVIIFIANAVAQGIDVTNMDAVPIQEAAGRVLAHPIQSPDKSRTFPVGYKMRSADVLLADQWGIVYILAERKDVTK